MRRMPNEKTRSKSKLSRANCPIFRPENTAQPSAPKVEKNRELRQSGAKRTSIQWPKPRPLQSPMMVCRVRTVQAVSFHFAGLSVRTVQQPLAFAPRFSKNLHPGQIRSSRFAVARAPPFREFRPRQSGQQNASGTESGNATRAANNW
jgi:hypothetical protein